RQPADGIFEFVWEEVPAAADDDVFHASGDVELATREVAEVAAIEPIAIKKLRCALAVAVITLRRGWAAKLDSADASLGQRLTTLVDDTDVSIGQRESAAHD